MPSSLSCHRPSAGVSNKKIDEIGFRLGSYPHYRLKGSNRYRVRIGDYRIIYTFDLQQNKIHLLAIGHRVAGEHFRSVRRTFNLFSIEVVQQKRELK